jgi:hypothetical protein
MQRTIAAVGVLGVAIAIGACGSDKAGTASPTGLSSSVDSRIVSQATVKAFSRGSFSAPVTIDNTWFPLVPGTQLVYQGRSKVGGRLLPHREVWTVTDLTKVVDGLRTLVVWDRDFENGHLEESELAFFAQDDHRNVWALGQYPEVYNESGKRVGAPNTWIVGTNAVPGISMIGDPQPGAGQYSQGFSPRIGWGDIAKVVKLGARSCVPVKCFKDVMVTDEANPIQPGDGHQFKHYAQGLGNLKALPGPGDTEQEVLDLVKIRHLGAGVMAAIRRDVKAMDKRAYSFEKRLYGRTQPVKIA